VNNEESRKIRNMFSNDDLLDSLYEIGMYIMNGFFSLYEIHKILYSLYGNTIIFSLRSLKMTKILYVKYCMVNKSLWNFVSYTVLYQLLKQNNVVDDDISILNMIRKNNLNLEESLYYLKHRMIKRFKYEEDFLLLEFKNLLIKQE